MTLRLVIFDVDGTLVDSQGTIHTTMAAAFEDEGLEAPSRGAVRSIVGLSLPQAVSRLAPDLEGIALERVVAGYKLRFSQVRQAQGAAEGSPLFAGARAALATLHAQPETLLGVATGKSRRGLLHLFEAHDLAGFFVTTQVADDHPSKPHPSMIETALAETGVAAQDAVMIGDTTFDMEMATAAGVPFLGVSWGYHAISHLTQAKGVLDDFADLPAMLAAHWGDQT